MMRHGCPHATRAAAARYGVRLDESDFRLMVRQIVAVVAGIVAPAILLARARQGREIWLTQIPHGPAVQVVYSPAYEQTAQAMRMVQVGCDVDGVVQPVAVAVAPAAGATGTAVAGIDVTLVHPAVVAACAAVRGKPITVDPAPAPMPAQPAPTPAPAAAPVAAPPAKP